MVLAVPRGDPRFADVRSLDLPKHLPLEIQNFFDTYEALEDRRGAVVKGRRGADSPWRAIYAARGAYRRAPP